MTKNKEVPQDHDITPVLSEGLISKSSSQPVISANPANVLVQARKEVQPFWTSSSQLAGSLSCRPPTNGTSSQIKLSDPDPSNRGQKDGTIPSIEVKDKPKPDAGGNGKGAMPIEQLDESTKSGVPERADYANNGVSSPVVNFDGSQDQPSSNDKSPPLANTHSIATHTNRLNDAHTNPLEGAQANPSDDAQRHVGKFLSALKATEKFLISPFTQPKDKFQCVAATLAVTMPVAIGVGVATGLHDSNFLSGLVAGTSIITIPTFIVGVVLAAPVNHAGSILPMHHRP